MSAARCGARKNACKTASLVFRGVFKNTYCFILLYVLVFF